MGTEGIPISGAYAGSLRRQTVPADVMLRASIYATLSLAIVLSFEFLDGTPASVPVAMVLAVGAAWVVERTVREGRGTRLLSVFFWLAAGHALYGYWAAKNSTDAIWIGTDATRMFRRSVFIVAATLVVAAFAYDVAFQRPPRWVKGLRSRLRVSDERMIRWARAFLVLGVVCVIYVVLSAGYIPILASDPGSARYLSEDLTDAYRWYSWVLMRGTDFLGCATPVVLFSGLYYRRKFDGLLGIAALAALLVTLQRGPLLSMLIVLLLTLSMVQGRFPLKYLFCLLLLGAAYFGAQMVFLGLGNGLVAALSGLPEVRDLGWVMSLVGSNRLHGVTYLVPLIPLPSYVVGASGYSWGNLNDVLVRMIGLTSADIGGLRITAGGEGFLNFGPLGILVVGVGFGSLCACLSRLERALLQKRDLASSYVVASLFVWLCFWFYLAGTGAAGNIKHLAILAAVLLFLAGRRRGETTQEAAD